MQSEKKRLTSAMDVLQNLFEGAGTPLAGQYCRWQLERRWSEVVGETVAAQSYPGNFINGTLYLGVSHPAWIHQLKCVDKELIKSVNEFVGKEWAKEIKFFVTPVESK